MSRSPKTPEAICVPATAMGERYLEVHAAADPNRPWRRGERTAFQRKLAERDLDQIELLADDLAESVDRFSAYQPRPEPFHDAREPLRDAWHEEGPPVTNRLAARLERDGVETVDPLPPVTYLDRELMPSRATGPSRFEQPKGTRIILDLLFAAGPRPVIAEVKAQSDENAYYALIQGLAACAQLAPPAQRQRLSDHYKPLTASGPLALWIVLADHNSRGRDKRALIDLSREIAAGLLARESVTRWVAEIACIDAVLPGSGPVRLTGRWP
jgi:hypothetical protein